MAGYNLLALRKRGVFKQPPKPTGLPVNLNSPKANPSVLRGGMGPMPSQPVKSNKKRTRRWMK